MSGILANILTHFRLALAECTRFSKSTAYIHKAKSTSKRTFKRNTMNFPARETTDRLYEADDAPLHSIKDTGDLLKAAVKELPMGSKLYVKAWGGEHAHSFFYMEFVRHVNDSYECIWLDADGRMILDYGGNVMFTALRGTCPVYVDAPDDTIHRVDDTILPLDKIILHLDDIHDATQVEDDDLRSARIHSPIPVGFPKIPATPPTFDKRHHRPLVSKQPHAKAGAKAAQPV